MAASVDIITLDNFQSKMPKWDPTASNHLFALVDMGSNGIRFSISDLSPPRARLLKSIYKERAAISLFDALNSSSDGSSGALVFPAETIIRVAQTLARFRSIAVEHYGVPEQNITVFATEAMRRAQNASFMLEAIRTEAGLNVQILAPAVETLFGAVGARSGFADVKGLFLDLGGGSVQMTYMDTYAARRESSVSAAGALGESYEIAAAKSGQSLPFGAARLIRVLNGPDLEVRASETSKLQVGMRGAFENLRKSSEGLAATVSQIQNHEDGAGLDVYLCGGGFRGYGSMLMHCDPVQPYPILSIGSYTVSGDLFCRTKDMVNVNQTYDGKIFGLSKRRRAQFPAIVTVVEALIAAVPKIRRVTFCSGGNREGALMMRFPKELRESDPVTRLVDSQGHDNDITQAILSLLLAALPASVSATIFEAGLGPLFVRQIWHNMGHDIEANASAALHDSLSRDPGCPGLTHFGRALLALMVCARWGGGLGPFDQQLRRNLQALFEMVDADAVFWAEYIGAVAATVATIVPSYPKTADMLRNNIKFEPSVDDSGKTKKLTLTLTVTSEASKGIDLADLEDLFKNVVKTKNNGDKRWKVKVQIQQVSRL
ncbi:Ppx/GppA phosphatase family-domain-containing protein [Coniochaeta sp. 2T2.1]|nr:Ppx/GppA phosphatase family-domain-containing protein [Coniochaeta sp. 2T2.1]